MSLAARMLPDQRLRWASGLCALNAIVVVSVAVGGRWGSSDEPLLSEPPAVELPVELPELPSASTPGTPAIRNDFVLDEIRNAIESDPALSVPKLSYPALESALSVSGKGFATRNQDVSDLTIVAQRIAVLHQLTRTSVELVKEAKLRASAGNSAQVASLMSELRLLRSLTARLASAPDESSSVPSSSVPSSSVLSPSSPSPAP